MSAENLTNYQPAPCQDDDEIDLLDILIVFAKNKFLILGTALIFALGAAGAATMMTPLYRATGAFTILPAATINQELAVNMTKSDQVIGDTALRLNLAENWNEPDAAKVISKIKKGLSSQVGSKNTPPSVTMESDDPKTAADIVNTVIEETGKRVIILHEKQMKNAGIAFTLLEEELQLAQNELSHAIKTLFETVQNYDIAQEEKNNLYEYQRFSYETYIKTAGRLPDGGAAYLEALRSIKTRESFYFSLVGQCGSIFEQLYAEPLTLNILEKASVPAQPIQPRKTMIVMMSGFLGGFVGIFGAFIREFARNAKKDPERKAKLEELSAAMRIFGRKG